MMIYIVTLGDDIHEIKCIFIDSSKCWCEVRKECTDLIISRVFKSLISHDKCTGLFWVIDIQVVAYILQHLIKQIFI